MHLPLRQAGPPPAATHLSRPATTQLAGRRLRVVPADVAAAGAASVRQPTAPAPGAPDGPALRSGLLDFERDLFRVLVAVRRRQARLDPVHDSSSLVDQIVTAMIGPLDGDEVEVLAAILSEVGSITTLRERSTRGAARQPGGRPSEGPAASGDRHLVPVTGRPLPDDDPSGPEPVELLQRAVRVRTCIEDLLDRLERDRDPRECPADRRRDVHGHPLDDD